MPCRYLPLAAGTYYALCRAEPPHLIFAEPHEYEDFALFLAHTLQRTGTKLLGYCWMPDAIHLALAVRATPLSEVMRRVTRYCSRRIHRRTGAKATYIASSPIMLSDPETHLSILLRYLHRIPVIAGAAESPDEYPYTSRRMYARELQGFQVRAAVLRSPELVRRFH